MRMDVGKLAVDYKTRQLLEFNFVDPDQMESGTE